jgi:hypothetical protein
MENCTPSEYAPACSIQRLAELQGPGTGRRVVGGGWLVAAAEIMTSVDIIVGTLFLVRPPRRDLAIHHGHGVDNCSLRFYKNGRRLDLGESRSPTQIFEWNRLLASHRLWVYVSAFGADGDDGDGDDGDGDDGDDDGVGDGDHSSRST